ncbi:MAG TPA: DPP IV N-terminal domain-containing protein, partial [Thermoanaerobaculia bacterium]|nr:DPP IV N-terminal domain-containing protein [Thermoanaerobaculia bacterium]
MKRALCVVVAFIAATTVFAQQKRAFTIEDLYRVKGISDLALSPDQRSLAFTVSTTDLPRAKRSTQIWIMNADGSNAHALTQGNADSSPRFSPDGKEIAFIRENDGDTNLFLLPLGGGEARQLTHISTGVSDPLWSPDGKWIAFSTDVYPECNGDDACNKRIADRWSKGKLHAHMADALLYRHWTEWRDSKATHVWLADVESGETHDLTPGTDDYPPFELGGPLQYAFSPDSTELAVASNHDPDPQSSTNNDLFLISLTTPKASPR